MFKATGDVTLGLIKDGTTTITDAFTTGTFTSEFDANGDAAALTEMQGMFTSEADAINADYSTAAGTAAATAGAGAFQEGSSWAENWTIGL